MSRIWTITQKELKSYFVSPVAWALLALFAVCAGFFAWVQTANMMNASIQSQFSGRQFPMSVNDWVVRPTLSVLSTVALFLIPMIAMRMFAEEKRSGTIELLLTSPVSDLEIILGKWLGSLIMYAAMLGVSALDIFMLYAYGKPDWRPILVAYLGLLLQGGALLAVGAFISTMTRNQIIAGASAFTLSLMLYVINWLTEFDPSSGAKVLAYLSVLSHFEPFSKGVIDTKDVIFYVSMIFFGLFLTARSLESLRWRA